MPTRRIRRADAICYARAHALRAARTPAAEAAETAAQARAQAAQARVLAILERASREQGGTDNPALDAVAVAGLMAALNG